MPSLFSKNVLACVYPDNDRKRHRLRGIEPACCHYGVRKSICAAGSLPGKISNTIILCSVYIPA